MAGDRLARVLAALAAARDGSASLATRLCDASAPLLGVSGAAMSVRSDSHYLATVCVSDDVAARLEELHLTLGEGPGLDAHQSGRPVVAADLDGVSASRWPVFTESALEAGARALFAFPLRIGAIRLGVLTLYRTTPGPLDAIAFGDALMLAHFGAQALVTLSAQAPAEGFRGDLIDGATLWAEVHQATGMVAAQLGVGIQEAFVRLQAHAYATGRLVGEVGADVVARRLRFEADGA